MIRTLQIWPFHSALFLIALLFASGTNADIVSDLQTITDTLATKSGVASLLRIDDSTQGSFSLAAGVRDTNTLTAAQPSDLFRIASNSKSFTATAILLLRDEGRFSLTNTVLDLLPAVDIPSNGIITVWNLLTHTSGLPDHNNDTNYFDVRISADPSTNFAPDEVFEVVRSLTSHFAPGEAWSYCDTGYYVLHLIIEAHNTNGWSFANFIRNRLIVPLGLTNTFVPDSGNNFLRILPGDHLNGYLLDDDSNDTNNVTVVGQSWDLGCGGMVSSTEDLTTWIRALHDGSVLGPESQTEMEMVTIQSRQAGDLYGMATMVSPFLGYGHSGITLGYISWMYYDPVHQTAYAAIVNLENEDLFFSPLTSLIDAQKALGYTNHFQPFEPGATTNIFLGAGKTAWLTMTASSNTYCTLDLTSTNLVSAYISKMDGSPIGKLLPAYGLTFSATNLGEYLIAVYNDGLEPAFCQLASFTNGLPFYSSVTNTVNRPEFMTNEWYNGSEFGYVYVPASRITNDVHSYRLPVVKLAAGPDATNGPLIYLSGGPGSSAINQPYIFHAFTNTCKVILFNQRGTYLSQPDLFPLPDGENTLELQQRLGGSDGMDFNTISTRENAADVHDVATALGYNQFNIWGTSYGTLLAQETLRQHPERIRSMIIDGVVAPNQPQWTTMGETFYTALQALTNDIEALSDVNRLYPDFFDTLMDYAATLTPNVENDYDYNNFLYDSVFHQMNLSRWGYVEDVPGIVWRAARGEREALNDLFRFRCQVNNPAPDGPLSEHMYAIILRHDMLPFENMDTAAALTNSIPFPLNMVGYDFSLDQFQESEDWAFITPEDASFHTLVTNDRPVLVMNGQYDTQTSLAHARLVASNLPNAYLVEFPYVGHVVLFGGDVPAQIARDFLTNPSVFPDTNSISSMTLSFSPPWPTNTSLLAAGQTFTNSLDEGEGAWVRFNAVSGLYYRINFDNPEDVVLRVVNDSAEIAGEIDTDDGYWLCPQDETFFLWVVAQTNGNYQLKYEYPLLIRSIEQDEELATLSWQSETGNTYGVWFASNLLDETPFTLIESNIVAASQITSYSNTLPANRGGYFRIQSQDP